MLPLDGLWLNASKPEPSLETYVKYFRTHEFIGPSLASANGHLPSSHSRLRDFIFCIFLSVPFFPISYYFKIFFSPPCVSQKRIGSKKK